MAKGLDAPSLVSTHSRLKAAGYRYKPVNWRNDCFNTQPPEGGWAQIVVVRVAADSFNTQPPEGGWFRFPLMALCQIQFQHTAA